MIRINRNTELISIHGLMFDIIVIGTGNNSAISVSEIMKITAAIRKNSGENSSCAEFFESNPHSNGDFFLGFL